MQTDRKTNKNSRSQEIRTLDMRMKQTTKTQLNTSWNIRKLADLASLLVFRKLNLKEAMQKIKTQTYYIHV